MSEFSDNLPLEKMVKIPSSFLTFGEKRNTFGVSKNTFGV